MLPAELDITMAILYISKFRIWLTKIQFDRKNFKWDLSLLLMNGQPVSCPYFKLSTTAHEIYSHVPLVHTLTGSYRFPWPACEAV